MSAPTTQETKKNRSSSKKASSSKRSSSSTTSKQKVNLDERLVNPVVVTKNHRITITPSTIGAHDFYVVFYDPETRQETGQGHFDREALRLILDSLDVKEAPETEDTKASIKADMQLHKDAEKAVEENQPAT